MPFLLPLVAIAGLVCAEEKITFEDHAKPIFQQRCASCHNGDRKSGGLDLTNFTNMMQGGSSGTSIEPGDAENSYLFQLVTHEESPEMPPGGNKIPDSEIAVLRSWIDGGALENKGSIVKRKKSSIAAPQTAIGVRPEQAAYPMRLSLEPCLVTNKTGIVGSIATSPWAGLVALSGSKQILLYDSKDLQFLGTLPFPEGRANDLKFSRSGSVLIAGGGRHGLVGQVIGWDVVSGTRLFEIGEEQDNVLAADISVDHSLVALGGPQKMIRLFSTETEELVYEVKKHTDWVTAIEFSPDGVLLASADRNGGLQLWEAESGNEYLSLGGHNKSITDLSWRFDGNVLASCGEDGAVRLWEVENGRQVKSWNAHGPGVSDVEFTRDGRLVTTGRDSTTRIWQSDGKLIRQFEGLDEVGVSVSYCNETEKLFTGGSSGSVIVWNSDNVKKLGSISANPPLLQRRLRTAENKVARLIEQVRPLEVDFNEVSSLVIQAQSRISDEEKAINSIKTELQQTGQILDTTKTNIESNERQKTELQKLIETVGTALPQVERLKNQAKQTSDALHGDEKLREIAEAATARFDQLQSDSKQYQKQIAELESKQNFSSTVLAKIESKFGDQKSALKDAQEKRDLIGQELVPLQERRNKLKKNLNLMNQKLVVARAQVVQWNNEIVFSKALREKTAELDSAKSLQEQRQANVEKAKMNLNQAQNELEAAMDVQQRQQDSVQQIQNELLDLRTRK